MSKDLAEALTKYVVSVEKVLVELVHDPSLAQYKLSELSNKTTSLIKVIEEDLNEQTFRPH